MITDLALKINRASPIEAHALKENGFPQPDPAAGQLWHHKSATFIAGDFEKIDYSECCYAPTLEEVKARIMCENILECDFRLFAKRGDLVYSVAISPQNPISAYVAMFVKMQQKSGL